ncbi:MAG: HAD hydrolase-like protein [Oscillospiraceae bacterium]|nr:HAD hydrolase-like protein [Oscillospiraceae bacterium]
MKRYNTILFDLDGTLTDSSPGILNSVKYALTEMGREIPDEKTLGEFLGPPLTDSFTRFCGMTDEEAREAAGLYRKVYMDKSITENSLYEGIVQTLERLKNAGKVLAVATTKPIFLAERIVTHYGIRDFFIDVCGSAPDGSGGDKAGVIRSALKVCGEPDLSQALMIGDRFYDIEGAKTVGIDSVGVLYGYGSRSELENAGATYIVSAAAEIAEFIL